MSVFHLPSPGPSVSLTAARPGYPAGSALSHDREPSEDVQQANKAKRETLSASDTGMDRYVQECAL